MSVDLDERTDIRELEDSLQLILFGDGGNATAVVLLVRSALSAGDRPKAERLASAAQHLTEATLAKSDMDAAACHVRGLIERNADLLQQAADQYAAPLACALATEDAGVTQAAQGHQQNAVEHVCGPTRLWLGQPHRYRAADRGTRRAVSVQPAGRGPGVP